MNYRNLIYDKIKNGVSDYILFFEKFRIFCIFEIYFCILVVFVLYIVMFNAFMGLWVIFCIYEHILKICFDMFGESVQKCEQFSYELFVWDFGFWGGGGPKWSPPPPPTPSPASMSKFPPQGKFGKTHCFSDFYDFYENEKIKWKMVLQWLRRVAFARRDAAEARK